MQRVMSFKTWKCGKCGNVIRDQTETQHPCKVCNQEHWVQVQFREIYSKKMEVIIVVGGGLVQKVLNLPEGWDYDVLDKDIITAGDEDDIPERNRVINKLRELDLI